MEKKQFRSSVLIGLLIALTCSAMAYSKIREPEHHGKQKHIGINDHDAIITLSGQLPQSKIHMNGDGRLAMGITIAAKDLPESKINHSESVDLIIVLDRSGSMKGKKIQDAKQAIINIINTMGGEDRFGLLSYSDSVLQHAPLLKMTPANRNGLISSVRGIYADGGTNLGSGLQEAIRMLTQTEKTGNSKIILISDGMANQGITNPTTLGRIAAQVVKKEASISTIGVGVEFNEYLMTSIADQGSGTYHFLEDPDGFAAIFQEEFSKTKIAVATGIEIHIPLEKGMILREAAGYPVENKHGFGIFRSGSLLPGQSRTFFISLQVPTGRERDFTLHNISARYLHNGAKYTATLPTTFHFACIQDHEKALASIDKKVWEKKVAQDDVNKLREDVARDISSGKKDAALKRISRYKAEQEGINSVVGSQVVADTIEDLDSLKEEVNQTFRGAPAAVVMQQKKASKSLQHKSYEGRRAIQ